MNIRLTALLFSAVLAACGGGGDDGTPVAGAPAPAPSPAPGPSPSPSPSPSPAPAPTPAPSPAPAERSVSWESEVPPGSTSAQLQVAVNAQGARGFRYISDLVYVNGNASETRTFYVKDSSDTYTYEVLPLPASRSVLVAQANAQGARGYRFAGLDVRGAMYRKVNASSATYAYQALNAPDFGTSASSSANFLAQANPEGANGWRYLGPLIYYTAGDFIHFYERAAQGAATYAYEATGYPATDADFLAQVNSQGARGFRLLTTIDFIGDRTGNGQALRNLYVKDTSQASTFSYQSFVAATTASAALAQFNAQGALGFGSIGDLIVGGGTVQRSYFFKPATCSGVLCDSRSPFGG